MALESKLTITTTTSVLSIAYLRWTLSFFLIINKGNSILAVLKVIWGYPLVTYISSLCGYPCHNTVFTKIHLKPLIYIICPCWPCPCFVSKGLEVQPSLNCGMILIIFWRSSDLSVSYLSVLHTHWCWTRFTQEKEKYWLDKIKWPTWLKVSKTYLKNCPSVKNQYRSR